MPPSVRYRTDPALQADYVGQMKIIFAADGSKYTNKADLQVSRPAWVASPQLGRALMGSAAQRVVADCEVPVLLVK